MRVLGGGWGGAVAGIAAGMWRAVAGRLKTVGWVALVGATLTACDGRGELPSAGGLGPIPILSAASIVSIGGASATGPAALGFVRDATLLDGHPRIAIADHDAQEIRVFDLDGRYVETLGRRGEGPGEYRGLAVLAAVPSGGIAAWDGVLRRATLHLRGGNEVVRPDLSDFPDRRAELLGVRADTTLVFGLPLDVSPLQGGVDRIVRDTVPFVVVDQAGRVRAVMATAVAPGQYFFDRPGVWGLESMIFGADLQFVFHRHGLLVGSGDQVGLRRHGDDGVDTLPLPIPPGRAVSRTEIEAERQRRLDEVLRGPRFSGATEGYQSLHREVIAGLDAERTAPAFDDLVAGPDGSLWIKTYSMPVDSVAEWTLLSPEEVPLGRVQLPASERLMSGTAEAFVTRGRDELNASVVTIYRLARR